MTTVILRGVSGSGKSFAADAIKSLNTKRVEVCTADDYFIDENGNYNFDRGKLSKAHVACFEKFRKAIESGEFDMVIVANTNTSEWEFKKYSDFSLAKDVPVVYLVVENRHGNSNSHGCPDEAIEKQKQNLTKSLQWAKKKKED